MNKEEAMDLFQEQLSELDNFEKDIKEIRKLINLIVENIDLLKDDVTEDQIGEISSDVNVKISKVIALVKDILADSKKLKSFIHEIKLLKRKREAKLKKNSKDNEIDLNELADLLKKFKDDQNKNKKILPKQPYKNPWENPYINKPNPPNRWDRQF